MRRTTSHMRKGYIEEIKGLLSRAARSPWLVHSARTAFATAGSLAVASLFSLPEAYWAAITTLIVMQSTLGAAWAVSKARLVGTGLGAAAGALLASCLEPRITIYGLAIFFLGLICGMFRLEQSAYRFAGITLTIVMLVARAQAPWVTGIHRFVEVSLGIGGGLIFTAVWPNRESPGSRT